MQPMGLAPPENIFCKYCLKQKYLGITLGNPAELLLPVPPVPGPVDLSCCPIMALE